jgi:hypothetical protein
VIEKSSDRIYMILILLTKRGIERYKEVVTTDVNRTMRSNRDIVRIVANSVKQAQLETQVESELFRQGKKGFSAAIDLISLDGQVFGRYGLALAKPKNIPRRGKEVYIENIYD